jgi:ribosomal protein L24E
MTECAWCGAEIDPGERVYRRREEPREAYCCRSHRDAATAAVKALRDQYDERKAASGER